MIEPSRLWIVIPVHNRRDLTRRCLGRLDAQVDRAFEVVVVDDGSSDGTSEMIRHDFPGVNVLIGDGSLWWSGACNLGVRHALAHGATHVLLLNDDTEPASDMVAVLKRDAAAHERCLLVARSVDVNTGESVYTGERIDWVRGRFVPFVECDADGGLHGLHPVTHTPGRGLLVPSETFEEVGLFDARAFPQTAADYDFSQRAARAGYELFCDYDAVLSAYPEETGGSRFRGDPSIANLWRHLFSRKGAGNLPYFWRYGARHAPRSTVVPFLVAGTARRVGGYIRDWPARRRGGE